MLSRVGRFIADVARHAVPIGGVFGRDWHPVTALAVYWLESVALVVVAAALASMMKRRAPPSDIKAAGIEPRDLLVFFLGSLSVFGGFLAGVLLIAFGNGHIAEPMRWPELREGAQAMLAVIAIGLLFDLWSQDRLTVRDVQGRVNACVARWGLFWLVGFVGTLLMIFTGRATIFFGFFAVLKVIFETWGRLARMLGWRPTAATPAPDRSMPHAAPAPASQSE